MSHTWQQDQKKLIFDYKMYISYRRCCHRSQMLLSSKAWPLWGRVGWSGDFAHVAVFKRHQIREQAPSGATWEVETKKDAFGKSADQVQTAMRPKTSPNHLSVIMCHTKRNEVVRPRPSRCIRDNPQGTTFRNLFWHICFYLFSLY